MCVCVHAFDKFPLQGRSPFDLISFSQTKKLQLLSKADKSLIFQVWILGEPFCRRTIWTFFRGPGPDRTFRKRRQTRVKSKRRAVNHFNRKLCADSLHLEVWFVRFEWGPEVLSPQYFFPFKGSYYCFCFFVLKIHCGKTSPFLIVVFQMLLELTCHITIKKGFILSGGRKKNHQFPSLLIYLMKSAAIS